MYVINPEDFGIKENLNIDLGANFLKMLQFASTIDEAKIINLNPGSYNISYKNAMKELCYITNTTSRSEYREPIHTIGLYFKDIKDLYFDGNGASINMDGFMSNVFIRNCQSISLNNFKISHIKPAILEAKVVSKIKNVVEYSLNKGCPYEIKHNHLILDMGNYKYDTKYRIFSYVEGVRYLSSKPNEIKRSISYPFKAYRKIKKMDNGNIQVYYWKPIKCEVGDIFCVFGNKRKEVGIFIDSSGNIKLNGIEQNFNISHGIVSQLSKNIEINKVNFSCPNKVLASHTDFLHFCCCSGDINVKNSFFKGANDDCINVHGIHFSVIDIMGKTIRVAFSHPQTYGFNPFEKDDLIAGFSGNTMLKTTKDLKVVSSKMVDLYIIDIELDDFPKGLSTSDSIDILNKNPNLSFINNSVQMITTRGVLCTTSGKVRIKNNNFIKTRMSPIFISNDSSKWYESGAVKDVIIESNIFDDCAAPTFLIWPENKKHDGPIHNNIKILNNVIKSTSSNVLKIKSTSNVEVINNKLNDHMLNSENVNCTDVENMYLR